MSHRTMLQTVSWLWPHGAPSGSFCGSGGGVREKARDDCTARVVACSLLSGGSSRGGVMLRLEPADAAALVDVVGVDDGAAEPSS